MNYFVESDHTDCWPNQGQNLVTLYSSNEDKDEHADGDAHADERVNDDEHEHDDEQ